MVAKREKLLVELSLSIEGNDHPNFDTPSPARVLIVALVKNTTVDMFKNVGRVMREKGGG